MTRKRKWIIVCFAIFPLIVGLACTCGLLPFGSDTSAIEEEIQIIATEVAVIEETIAQEIEETVIEEPVIEEVVEVPEVEEVEEFEEVIIQPGEELIVTELTWLQEERDVYISFNLVNQYPDKNLEYVEYWIKFFDAEGEEIRSQWSNLQWLFAQDKVGVFYKAYMKEDDPTVDSIVIEHKYSRESPAADFSNPFTIENLKLWEGGSKLVLTGVVKNDSDIVYTTIRLNYICYDVMDQAVGGGYAYVGFVPGNDGMGFNGLADTYGEVVRVEIFPTITINTKTYEDTPELWQAVTAIDANYEVSRFGSLMGGLVIQNNTADTLFKNIEVILTFADADGYITTYGSQRVPFLFPGDTLGVSPNPYMQPTGATSVDYFIYILPGDVIDDYDISENVFRVDEIEITGDANQNALVTFTNTSDLAVTEVELYVLAFDPEGTIIGGAKSTIKDPFAAGLTTAEEINFFYNRDYEVAEVQAWVIPAALTKFE